jgi:hypothetical protein
MIKKFENFNNIKVSFDFDNCLGDSEWVQEYCKDLISRGVEVWIVTSRPENPEEFFRKKYTEEQFQKEFGITFWSNDEDLYPLADNLGIPKTRIVFTNHDPKAWWFVENPNFIWHLDDNTNEIRLIHRLTKIVPISVLSPNWKNKCEKLLR